MTEPDWLELDIVLDFHAEQLALFGGPDGIRDLGLLESALARPQNKFAYGETDLAALAASYGFGIARNHPFVDGNKRTALASMIVFAAFATLVRSVINAEKSPLRIAAVGTEKSWGSAVLSSSRSYEKRKNV